MKKLEEVCRLINGKAYKKIELLSEGKYPVLRVGNLFTNNKWYYSDLELHEDKYCDNEDLIYAWSASFGPRIWKGGKVIYHYHIWKVIPNFQRITRDYLFHLFEWDKDQIKSAHGTGTTMMHVGKGSMENRVLPIPPLAEQKKIVTLLDAAFAKIDQAKANIEKNIANAKELLESFSQSIFKKNIKGNDSETLNEICELIVDCEHKTAPTQNIGYPSIRTPNIGYGELILDKVNRVSEEVYLKWSRRAIPKPGDLILAREAPAGNIGVIPKDTYVCLGQRTVLIRPKKEKFISKYLAFLILSKDVQKRLLSHSHGATVGHINMRDIRAFKIFNLPSLKEQNRVVEKVETVLNETRLSEQQYYKKLQHLEELKKSLLQKAFAGELT